MDTTPIVRRKDANRNGKGANDKPKPKAEKRRPLKATCGTKKHRADQANRGNPPKCGKKKRTSKSKSKPDIRKQLFNEGLVGPIQEIQVSAKRIVQLNAIMFDLDPGQFRAGHVLPEIPECPQDFYREIIQPMLDRHPTLAKCEVRMTGTGLHAILWFDDPVVFEAYGDLERWAAMVQVVQAALPIDPDQPGITATTRAVGSTNSKNGEKVCLFHKGTKVTEAEVIGLYEEMCSSPFVTVMKILTGDKKTSPCPICGEAKATLKGLDYVGTCYGSCGQVSWEQLYDTVLAPRETTSEDA